MRHDDAGFAGAVKRFQDVKEPSEIAVFLRRDTVAVKPMVFVLGSFYAITPRLVGKRRIHYHKVKFSKFRSFTDRCRKCRVDKGVAFGNFSRPFLVKDKVHLGQTCGGMVFFLTKNSHDGVAVSVHGCLVRCPD